MFFRFMRRFNDGIPTKSEVLHYIPLFQRNPYNIEILWTMKLYAMGEPINNIAKDFGVTRERVRQRLLIGIVKTKKFHDGMRQSLKELKALHDKKRP
jgi:hypothetical protein